MRPIDFGPIYAETDLSRFPVEPWNTYSNLIFLALLLFFAAKTSLNYRKFPVLVFSLPVLFIGFIGGTIYHATRAHMVWLLMDFIPIFVLAVAASLFFWQRLLKSTILSTALVLLPMLLPRLLVRVSGASFPLMISMGYVGLGLTIVAPAVIFCSKHAPALVRYPLLGMASFAAAIGFRILDSRHLISMGTHFLWHIFGGLAAWAMMQCIYLVERQERID